MFHKNTDSSHVNYSFARGLSGDNAILASIYLKIIINYMKSKFKKTNE